MPSLAEKPTVPLTATPPIQSRLVALDALRGFDMFWIMGGDTILRSLHKIHDSAITRTLEEQMEHCPWAGFHFYDLIFPMFVFIVGVSLVFSVSRMIERDGFGAAVRRIVVRSIILFLLGVFYMGGVANGFKNVYLAGVLHRISVAYFFAALIFGVLLSGSRRRQNLARKQQHATNEPGPRIPDDPRSTRYQDCGNGHTPGDRFLATAITIICTILLVGYWALMTFVPVPGIGTPTLIQPGLNLAHYIDMRFLPGQIFEGTILSTIPAVANCLLGVLAGLLLKSPTIPQQNKVYRLLICGALGLALGFTWGLGFPIIKLLWTSSYVLVACGYSALLLAAFVQIVDIWKFQKWAQPFIWMGMNAITIYIIANVAGFPRLAARFVGGDIRVLLGPFADLAQALLATFFAFLVVWFLHRRKIFLRL